ncbi:hypothetical protein Glove_350g110 [Diversispora epigaea]|uniref:BTB domain-containing protein n=1 Tax=Diversispora epigaea TaxID=1348612 RepID=A0A397HHJ2_9GLOM|nr:hypothetical protein Glove_350g110 [Diversispora epigaea]
MTTKFFDRLSNDLTHLLEDPIDYNVTFEVGKAPNNQTFKIHSYILQSRSPYFKKNFNEIPFNDDHVKLLKMSYISVKIFNIIIKYIYSGTISLEKLEDSVIFDLLIASNEFELDELVEHLQTFLVENCASWLKLKFAQVYQTSCQVKNLEIIQEFYNDIISKHPNTIFESEKFYSLPEDALISILKRDDLQLDEGKIWEYTIQWGKAKNPTLPTNIEEWTNDNFLILKETLKQCLPYIRYFSISDDDVIEKIFPYQQILEPKLFLDINSKIMAPNRIITTSLVLPPRNILTNTLPARNSSLYSSSNIITDEHTLEISSWIDKKEAPYIEYNPYDFKLLVRGSRDGYIYGGIISLEKLVNSVIFDLLIASNEFELDELVEHLQTFLVDNHASWLKLKFAQIYQTSYQVKNLEIIQEFYNDIISKHPNTIFESEKFYSLPEDALISILKRDDLQLDEGKIWEYTIQWGKAKNPTLPTNIEEWTNDNFLILKETLKQCLPYIRYFSISDDDVIEKIFPYQQILEPKLFLDINSKIMAPNRIITTSLVLPPRNILTNTLPARNSSLYSSSNIITDEHTLEISSWIDKKEAPYIEYNPYDFKLLVRGSRDGFNVQTIYNICDKVSNTVIILKVKGTGEILGGYNPLEWNNNNNFFGQFQGTRDSFVFSLKTSNLKNSILSRVKNSQRSIYSCPRNSELHFGNALCLEGNLKIEKDCYCTNDSNYEKPIRSNEFLDYFWIIFFDKDLFSVEEYEVYKISPKSNLK